MNYINSSCNYKINESKEIYARPKQTLGRHIRNMVDIVDTIVERNNIKFVLTMDAPENTELKKVVKISRNYLRNYLSLILGTHDFGKFSKFFQQKIQRTMDKTVPILQRECRKYSYHTQTSSIFLWNILEKVKDYTHLVDGTLIFDIKANTLKDDIEIRDIIFDIMRSVASLSVLMHHNKPLDNNLEKIIDQNYYDQDISKIFAHIFDQSITPLDKIKEEFGKIFQNQELFYIVLNTYEDLRILDKNELIDVIDEMIYSISDFKKYLSDLFKRGNINSIYPIFFNFVYSSLCESDEWDAKFYIGDTPNHTQSFEPQRLDLKETLIEDYKNKKFLKNPKLKDGKAVIQKLRDTLYQTTENMINNLNPNDLRKHVYLIDAPTGAGKTLTLLNCGLRIRKKIENQFGYKPRILYALPFISIIEQVGNEIKEILKSNGKDVQNYQSQYLSLHHHLADSKWIDLEMDDGTTNSIKSGHHDINNWHSEIIVTSFVKLFNTICKSHKREVIRFHRLTGSILLIDEIQGIPVQYWKMISEIFSSITRVFGSTIILASATSPRSLITSSLTEKKILFEPPLDIMNSLARYNIYLDLFNENWEVISQTLSEFTQLIIREIENSKNSILVVLNTTKSVYSLFAFLHEYYLQNNLMVEELSLLSTQVLPVHRMDIINNVNCRLKDGKRIILICTQVIEAGVDVSFEKIFRDNCPLDSIIQVSGRCNRHFQSQDPGEVHLVSITAEGNKLADLTYKGLEINMSLTLESLKKLNKRVISEPELATLIKNYYQLVERDRVTTTLTEEFATGEFKKMYHKFNMIEDYMNRIPLLIIYPNMKKELEKYLKKRKNFPNKLRPYTIEITKSNLDRLKSLKLDSSIFKVHKKFGDGEIYVIYMGNFQNSDVVYSPKTGLVMKKFNI